MAKVYVLAAADANRIAAILGVEWRAWVRLRRVRPLRPGKRRARWRKPPKRRPIDPPTA